MGQTIRPGRNLAGRSALGWLSAGGSDRGLGAARAFTGSQSVAVVARLDSNFAHGRFRGGPRGTASDSHPEEGIP